MARAPAGQPVPLLLGKVAGSDLISRTRALPHHHRARSNILGVHPPSSEIPTFRASSFLSPRILTASLTAVPAYRAAAPLSRLVCFWSCHLPPCPPIRLLPLCPDRRRSPSSRPHQRRTTRVQDSMEDEQVNYGSPANAATPSSNPILAQPPLQADPSGAPESSEGRLLRKTPGLAGASDITDMPRPLQMSRCRRALPLKPTSSRTVPLLRLPPLVPQPILSMLLTDLQLRPH